MVTERNVIMLSSLHNFESVDTKVKPGHPPLHSVFGQIQAQILRQERKRLRIPGPAACMKERFPH
eukprot:1147789-Pelagomonas_calceolata.AAC.1